MNSKLLAVDKSQAQTPTNEPAQDPLAIYNQASSYISKAYLLNQNIELAKKNKTGNLLSIISSLQNLQFQTLINAQILLESAIEISTNRDFSRQLIMLSLVYLYSQLSSNFSNKFSRKDFEIFTNRCEDYMKICGRVKHGLEIGPALQISFYADLTKKSRDKFYKKNYLKYYLKKSRKKNGWYGADFIQPETLIKHIAQPSKIKETDTIFDLPIVSNFCEFIIKTDQEIHNETLPEIYQKYSYKVQPQKPISLVAGYLKFKMVMEDN